MIQMNLTMIQMNRNRLIDIENRLIVDRGIGSGKGMYWELELADANYYI